MELTRRDLLELSSANDVQRGTAVHGTAQSAHSCTSADARLVVVLH